MNCIIALEAQQAQHCKAKERKQTPHHRSSEAYIWCCCCWWWGKGKEKKIESINYPYLTLNFILYPMDNSERNMGFPLIEHPTKHQTLTTKPHTQFSILYILFSFYFFLAFIFFPSIYSIFLLLFFQLLYIDSWPE